VSAVTLGLAAAFVHAAQGFLSKDLTSRYPARPLIGVLLALNCLLVLPFAFFVDWHLSPTIVGLHIASAFMLVASSIPIWDLFDAGAASATITAQALSPLAAAVGAAILIPGVVGTTQVVAAVLVVVGVTWALRDAFAGLGRRGSIVRILVASTGVGLLTVFTRMLADEGVGVVETYVSRTAMGALFMLLVIPPRGIPVSAGPRLLLRSVTVTIYFVLIILAVQEGSPVVVQTMVAIAPLLSLGWESIRARQWPAPRALAGALLVAVGVALVLTV
jgi:drug/metabolite transporter (DMT)-like permease